MSLVFYYRETEVEVSQLGKQSAALQRAKIALREVDGTAVPRTSAFRLRQSFWRVAKFFNTASCSNVIMILSSLIS